jgi:folate-binding protein YgfZ
MIADLWVYELGDVILMTLAGDVTPTVLAKLDQFIFAEDVQLGDVTGTFGQTAVVGPGAAALVAGVVRGAAASSLEALPEHGNVRVAFEGEPAIVTAIGDAGPAGYDLYTGHERREALRAALHAGGAAELDPGTAETLRIEHGVPLFHRDMDEETIPLEAGIESRAISFSKGCYVGQEVIIRVLHRGHGRVARKLVGLTLEGSDVPAAGTAVHAGDRPIGSVTSAAYSPSLSRPIALAYVHRDFTEPATEVAVGGVPAVVARLPFVA